MRTTRACSNRSVHPLPNLPQLRKLIVAQVMRQVMESYDPGAVVLQCGTDSLSGDKLGCFNLSMRGGCGSSIAPAVRTRANPNSSIGHANCVKFIKSFNKPLLLVGGGGYTMRNVSRCWAYETGLAAGVELGKGMISCTLYSQSGLSHLVLEIPMNEYYEYFGPDYELDVKASNMDDMNSPEYLERVKGIVLDHLRQVGGPPSVQLQGLSFSTSSALCISDKTF